MARRRRRGCAGPLLAGLALFGLAAGAAVYFGPDVYEEHGARLLHAEHCTVDIDSGRHTLTGEQANNAAIIAGVAMERGLPARAVTIALATAIQESGLRNLDYGDRDSLGLFQQRPSQGWGSEEQVQDPYYAATQFYDVLLQVDGWRDMEVTVAAQTVQRSAFPNAYAAHEPEARLWASALTGNSGARAITCTVEGGPSASAQTFVDRLRADMGAEGYDVSIDTEGAVVIVAADEQRYASIATWAVATASTTGIAEVRDCERAWQRSRDAWVDLDARSCEPLAIVVAASSPAS